MDRAIIGNNCVSPAPDIRVKQAVNSTSSPATPVSVRKDEDGFRTPLSGRVVKQRSKPGLGSSKKLNAAFKSPMRTTKQNLASKQEESVESLNQEIMKLQKDEQELDQQINALSDEGYKTEELQVHIQKLHEYNEMKDIAQVILGQLALKKGVTTKDLYEEYDLDTED